MDLFEYQARDLFAKHGVPVLKGIVATTPEEAKAAAEEIGGLTVIKAQVKTGGRGKAGVVKLAKSPEEAYEHAKAILGMDIKGHTVRAVLISDGVDLDAEYYFSILLDRAERQYLAMCSREGGMDIETLAAERPEALARIGIDPLEGITPAVAHRLVGDAPTARALWARTSGDGSDAAPAARVRQALRGTGLLVSGSADGRTAFSQQIQRVTVVIGAVLGLTLLITLSGLANTTDVSVLERTREIGVLRAPGATHTQIRRRNTTEAALLAVIGALLGVLAGTALGAAGTLAILSDGGIEVAVPWLPLAGLLAVTLLVGVIASLRPAGRAAAIAPVAALATD